MLARRVPVQPAHVERPPNMAMFSVNSCPVHDSRRSRHADINSPHRTPYDPFLNGPGHRVRYGPRPMPAQPHRCRHRRAAPSIGRWAGDGRHAPTQRSLTGRYHDDLDVEVVHVPRRAPASRRFNNLLGLGSIFRPRSGPLTTHRLPREDLSPPCLCHGDTPLYDRYDADEHSASDLDDFYLPRYLGREHRRRQASPSSTLSSSTSSFFPPRPIVDLVVPTRQNSLRSAHRAMMRSPSPPPVIPARPHYRPPYVEDYFSPDEFDPLDEDEDDDEFDEGDIGYHSGLEDDMFPSTGIMRRGDLRRRDRQG